MKKRSLLIFALVFGLFIFLTPSSQAAEFKQGGLVHIQENEVVDGNFYVAASDLIIDGKIGGDLIGAAKNIKVNGEIAGDLIVAAQDIEVNGRVEGNIRSVSEKFSLNGFVNKNINALAQEIYLNPESFIGWDFLGAGQTVFVKGIINGGLNLGGENIIIDAQINKDTNIKLEGKLQSLTILPETTIGGIFNYSGARETIIPNQENFKQSVNFKKYDGHKERPSKKAGNIIFAILAALAVASFFFYGLKNINQGTMKSLSDFSLKDLLPVLIFFVSLPIIIIVLLVTIIGIPLALLLASFFFGIIYLAKIMAVIFLAKLAQKKLGKEKNTFLFLMLGIIIFWLIFALPYVGNIVATVATLFGLSGLIKYVRNKSNNL
ncbi:polymer-forming cytoskeletal protein [Patescibacteria group bacterium]|nr:polymer-forming cytoskeletal protein [Patescibacteria group bacterium]